MNHRVEQSSNRPRVLIVEDDEGAAETLDVTLRKVLDVDTCSTGRGDEALRLARSDSFDLMLVDLRLADMSGMEMIRTLQPPRPRFVLISAFLTVSCAVQAMKLGAFHVMEKPYALDDLLSVVSDALDVRRTDEEREAGDAPAGSIDAPAPPSNALALGTAVQRWAMLTVRTLDASRDPRTLDEWARVAGTSRSVLCEACRLVRIRPHDARDFARLLRAVFRSDETWEPETLLDVADGRTLHRLLTRAGLSGPVEHRPSIDEFLELQTWIPSAHHGLPVLRTLLNPYVEQDLRARLV
jgi:ActR/RegA family two-component response regulator